MNYMEDEEFLRDLQEEYRQDAADDSRYANRSAEEVLDDVEADFSYTYGELFETAYGKLVGELRDYGLDTCANDIFQNVLDEATGFVSPYLEELRINRKLLAERTKELNELLGRLK